MSSRRLPRILLESVKVRAQSRPGNCGNPGDIAATYRITDKKEDSAQANERCPEDTKGGVRSDELHSDTSVTSRPKVSSR
jgi:hypothetical protein